MLLPPPGGGGVLGVVESSAFIVSPKAATAARRMTRTTTRTLQSATTTFGLPASTTSFYFDDKSSSTSKSRSLTQNNDTPVTKRTTTAQYNTRSTTATNSNSNNNNSNTNNHNLNHLWDTLLQRFQGDFDNYAQVVQDRCEGRLPGVGGGHEHIHCTLVPIPKIASSSLSSSSWMMMDDDDDTTTTTNSNNNRDTSAAAARLAAFYFDGQPDQIFRFRYYHLKPNYDASSCLDERNEQDDKNDTVNNSNNNNNTVFSVDTILYTLHPALEQELRAASSNPLQWPAIFENFHKATAATAAASNDNNNNNNNTVNNNNNKTTILLPNCDVRWSWHMDPVLHAYASNHSASTHPNEAAIHAYMVHGQAVVDSQMIPGQRILIQDQLSLWSDEFWIHDRGYDPDTGAFIYGNQDGIPYRLERVAEFDTASAASAVVVVVDKNNKDENNANGDTQKQQQQQQQQRRVVNARLQWTLGPEYRSQDEYKAKIAAVGGPSGPTRPKSKQ